MSDRIRITGLRLVTRIGVPDEERALLDAPEAPAKKKSRTAK